MPDADFRALVDRANDRHLMSDIVGRYTDLKKRGPREKVGLCAFHQEKTPSLEVNDDKGTYYCHGCGKGGGPIRFLMEKEGRAFWDALQYLLGDELPVISEEERTMRKAADRELTAARIALARSIWSRTVDPFDTPAQVYARARGITAPLPPTVRFVMTPRWRNAETGEVGRDHPAMACALHDITGALVGVQCVYLTDGGRRKYERIREDGSRAKAKLSFGVIVGSALRLGPQSEHIVSCEGPEDGLTLMQQLPGKTVWAACGSRLLPQIEYPPFVRSVCLAGDNGAPGRAAVADARDEALRRGLLVSDHFPPPEFKDWNDRLRGIAS